MDLRYEEWLPGSDLEGIVTAYWRVAGDGSRLPHSNILPDGHVELVLNLGDRVTLAGQAYTGRQPERAVVGPLSKAIQLKYGKWVDQFGIRFHPARGAGFLGRRATTLADKVVPLRQVCATLDRALTRLLAEIRELETEAGRSALDGVLLKQLGIGLPPDHAMVMLVDRLNGSETAPRVLHLACEAGVSARQLQRRFLAAVGMAPKPFMRVRRFSRAWQLASMQQPETWAELAAAHGYADQAHMVRDFRAFGAEPPTRLFTREWYGATKLSRVSGSAEGVRFVQDPGRKPRA